jgi:hypothetical protein
VCGVELSILIISVRTWMQCHVNRLSKLISSRDWRWKCEQRKTTVRRKYRQKPPFRSPTRLRLTHIYNPFVHFPCNFARLEQWFAAGQQNHFWFRGLLEPRTIFLFVSRLLSCFEVVTSSWNGRKGWSFWVGAQFAALTFSTSVPVYEENSNNVLLGFISSVIFGFWPRRDTWPCCCSF